MSYPTDFNLKRQTTIILGDTIEIGASSEQIFEFLVHFEENFHTWHPDSVKCRYCVAMGGYRWSYPGFRELACIDLCML
jgi:hypothetical protein